jgi:hypothetical protein
MVPKKCLWKRSIHSGEGYYEKGKIGVRNACGHGRVFEKRERENGFRLLLAFTSN